MTSTPDAPLSPRSARVTAARRLLRRGGRAEAGRFLVEGPQAVREAVAAASAGDGRLHQLFTTAEGRDRHPDLVAGARAAGAEVVTVSAAALAQLTETEHPQGLVAVADLRGTPAEQVLAARPALVVVLADARDPGNAGSVVRAADAAGAEAVVLAGASVDPHNGKAVRASAGSLFHLPVVTGVPVAGTVALLREAGLRVLAADGSGPVDLDDEEERGGLAGPTAWLLGNEAWGLPDELLDLADAVVRVPLHGRAESLNLATAAAVCLYASARAQRRPGGCRATSSGRGPAPGSA